MVDEGVLGGRGEEVFLFVFAILGFVVGDVGEDVETEDRGGRDGGAGDDVCRAVRDVEERIIFLVVKNRPGELGGWGTWGRNNG